MVIFVLLFKTALMNSQLHVTWLIGCIFLFNGSISDHFKALDQSTGKKPDYIVYDQVLTRYVTPAGLVDYKGLRKDVNFQACRKTMSLAPPSNSWSHYEKMAYYINLYNMSTLQLICDHPEAKSIKDIPNAWDMEWIAVGKQKYSLNYIENTILRGKFSDPRIHFVINCAAKSCPKLYNHAYFPETLDKVMRKQAQEFVNDPALNEIKQDRAQLSQIFEWYRKDFVLHYSLPGYINQFSTLKMNESAVITFKEYDWSLNSK